MKNNFETIINDTSKVTTLCNKIEKELLVESVQNKKLIITKDKVLNLKELIVKILKNIVNSDIVNMELVILFENEIYLGIMNKKYVVYHKKKDNDEINILETTKELKRALELFYHYAYKTKKKNYLKKV